MTDRKHPPALRRRHAANIARGLTRRRGRYFKIVWCGSCPGWHVQGTPEKIPGDIVGLQSTTELIPRKEPL